MDERKSQILKTVVEQYADSFAPVPSWHPALKRAVEVSAATIRNELAELVRLGYLDQPHASAGRIPTDRGYRYFVDYLMEAEPVSPAVQGYIWEAIGSAPPDIELLADKLAETVAMVTGNAAVVSAPQGPRSRLKHIDLVSLQPREVLLILLVQGNLLRQSVLNLEQDTDQDTLTRLANRVNKTMAGEDREEIELRAGAAKAPLEREVLTHIQMAMDRMDSGVGHVVVHDGVRNLLRQPDFRNVAQIEEVLEVLEETRLLAMVLRRLVGDTDLQVVIGGEHEISGLRACTVVLTAFGPSRKVKGVVGAVGPTRMQYGQVVARLREIARAASERVSQPGAWS